MRRARKGLAASTTIAAAVAALAIGAGPARAQDQTGDDSGASGAAGGDAAGAAGTDGAAGDTTSALPDDSPAPAGDSSVGEGFDNYKKAELRHGPVAQYGVGVRLRGIFVPKSLLELFVDQASSGVFHPGFGLELSRRKDNFELTLGFEYENVSPKDGYWLDKGDDGVTPGQYPDRVTFDGLAWTTVDLAFLFHAPINDYVAFRYGAGFGLGLVLGDVLQTDQICGSRNFDTSCAEDPNPTGQHNDPAGIPPVFPVVDLLVGAQIRPAKNMTVNIEGGMRSVFFFGVSSDYFF